jgi:cytochrome c-type biogenesis protein CcmE
MDPARKRLFRFSIALTAALVLAGALAYTSFSASSPAKSPSQLATMAKPGETYQLTGKVVDGSIKHLGGDRGITFRVRDRSGSAAASVPVSYNGIVPDPFRDGREIIITVSKQGSTFVGNKDSLITKCPSKFSDTTPTAAPSNT